MKFSTDDIKKLGIETARAKTLIETISSLAPELAWRKASAEFLSNSDNFESHKFLFEKIYENWDWQKGPPPAWFPEDSQIQNTNLFRSMSERGFATYEQFYNWSINHRDEFWGYAIQKIGLVFKEKYQCIRDKKSDNKNSKWLLHSKLNIADSCFQANPESIAISCYSENKKIGDWTYKKLNEVSNQVANGLCNLGFSKSDRFAIAMPMTAESIAIYLGIVKMGGAVVSIADSFASDEIQTRLRISNAKCVFTQDVVTRAGKILPMFEKVRAATSEKIIVLPEKSSLAVSIRNTDLSWESFLSANKQFSSQPCLPEDVTNVLFSSGTTGDPKAIPWSHTTPIKCAVDAYFHHDIQPGEIIAWPTNLGWMMGPWLIYASLINKATIALYYGAPSGREFGEFVQNAKINMLGLVPSIVKSWRSTGCMQGLDWSSIKLFSSTGECSNAEDYLFLMSLAGYKPVIEYCGGTEIGGGYLTGTLLQAASPATFTTPSVGLSFYILDEDSKPADNGELFLVPPSIGLSQELLNKNHDEVYFFEAPKGPKGEVLRRHGDQVEKLSGGYYRALGRADDTMNLGGIKISSAEIERTLNQVEGVLETAAIAVNPPGGGPSLLVVFTVIKGEAPKSLRDDMQRMIREKLNPLFKIHDVVLIGSLPRTASNKIMRRTLRSQYKK